MLTNIYQFLYKKSKEDCRQKQDLRRQIRTSDTSHKISVVCSSEAKGDC